MDKKEKKLNNIFWDALNSNEKPSTEPKKVRDGIDGYIPIKGRDYFDGKDGKNADVNDVIDAIKELKGVIPLTAIKDGNLLMKVGSQTYNKSEKKFDMDDQRWHGAGTGVGVSDHAALSNLDFATAGHTGFQATLVSATNIKTINGSSILGSGDLVVTGVGTVTDVSVATANGLNLRAGQTYTTDYDSGSLNGSGATYMVDTVTTEQFTISKSSGTVDCDYLDLSNSNAAGGATWNAGAHSLDTTNNDGWIFSSPPVNTGNIFAVF